MTYRDNDYSFTDGLFGVQVHHPQFLQWEGAPESARLLDTAHQLQCDACLMTSNLSVLDQYALCLYEASDVLELVVGRHDFPSVAIDAATPVLRVRRASTHMEAMVLWWAIS